MLIAIEGCDRTGKTTLFTQLRPLLPFATFVAGGPFDIALKPVARLVEERDVRLWSALYDPAKVYIADRCPFVDNVVYAEVYGREPVSYPEWRSELRVLYTRRPPFRTDDPWDPDYERERGVYDRVIGELEHEVVLNAQDATQAIYKWVVAQQNEGVGLRARLKHLERLAKRGRAHSEQLSELKYLRVTAQRRRVEELRGYWRGSFGQPLGLPAVGPCDLRDREVSHWCTDLLGALPPRPSGAVLCHRCDERRCAEPLHVFWGTQRDNARDAVLKGRRRGRSHAELLTAAEAELGRLLSEMISSETPLRMEPSSL